MTTNGRVPNFINGQWQNPAAQEFSDVINPATGESLAQAPLGGDEDVAAAVESAAAAFPEWRSTPPEERIQYLFRLKIIEKSWPASSPPRTGRPLPKRGRNYSGRLKISKWPVASR